MKDDDIEEGGGALKEATDETSKDTDVEKSGQDESNDSIDDEVMDTLLTESIRESLSARNSDVREAAHRLLRNRMVEVDRISEGSGSQNSSTNSKNSQDLGVSPTEYASMEPMGGGDQEASETTSLLKQAGDKGSMGAMNNFG